MPGVNQGNAKFFSLTGIMIFNITGDQNISALAVCGLQQEGAAAATEGDLAHRSSRLHR